MSFGLLWFSPGPSVVTLKKGLVLEIYQCFGSIKSIDILKKLVPSLKEVKSDTLATCLKSTGCKKFNYR